MGCRWVTGATAATAVLGGLVSVAPAQTGPICPNPVPHECSTDPPSASFTWSPESPKRRQPVEFTGTASANPDRSVRSTTWDLDDDGAFDDADSPRATWRFETAGTHRVRFRVEDSEGAAAVATREVGVAPLPQPADLTARPGTSVAYQANAQRDGFIDTGAPAPPLAKRWSRELGRRVSYPVVAEGRLFVAADLEETLGTVLYALDPRTGAILWTRDVGDYSGGGRSHLVYDRGRLIAESSNGAVTAHDPATGAPLWSSQFLVTGRRLPLAEGGQAWTTTGGIGGTLIALDGATGEFAWYDSEIGSESSPAADGANVYVAHMCEGVTAFERSGIFRWQSGSTLCASSGTPGFVPVVHGGRTYARADIPSEDTPGWVVRNDDGTVVDDFLADEAPAFKGDVGLFPLNGKLTARNVAANADMWTFAGDGRLVTAPLIVGDVAYVGSASGRVYALALGTGQELWSDVAGKEMVTPGEGRELVAGLGAGDGALYVPAGGTLTAYAAPAPPPKAAHDRFATVRDLPPPASGGGESTTHQVDEQHTGFLNVAQPAPPLRRRWTRSIGDQTGYPIVAEGKAFGYGTRGHTVHAFDLATGRPLWTRETVDERAHSRMDGAAYDDGKLFVNAGGGLIAFRASDGTELWRNHSTDGGSSGAPPVADGGLVYTSASNGVAAYHQSDGSRAWRTNTNGALSSSPALDQGRAYVSYACLNASAHDRASGATAWAIHPAPCGGGGGAAPALHGGRLYALEKSALFALDPATGALLDSFSTERQGAFAGSAGVFLNGKVLQAVDLATGTLAWSLTIPGAELRTPPLVVGRHVYVGSEHSLFAVRLETGVPEWRDAPGSPFPPTQAYEQVDYHGFAAGGGYVVAATGHWLVAYGPHGGLKVDARNGAKRLARAVRRNLRRKGGVKLDVAAPGAGRVDVRVETRGRALLTSGSAKTKLAGAVEVRLRPTRLGKRVLVRSGRIPATVRISFVPAKGSKARAQVASRKLTLLR